MTEPIWNWQTKVNRLRRILDGNALDRTFDVSSSTDSGLVPVRTMTDINVSAESQWSTSTNVSESLVKFINYSDFEEIGEMNRVSPLRPVDSQLRPATSKADFIHENERETIRRTVNSLCDVTTTIDEHGSSNKSTSECNSGIDSHPSLELVSCVPVLEVAKSNIVALIDDYIALIRDKANSVQLQLDERIKQLKLIEVRKTIERRNHIQQIREEITAKMNNLNKLLDELERI